MLTDLDKNLLIYILEFCHPSDIISISQTNKNLRIKALNDTLWIKIVKRYFGNVLKSDIMIENPTWFQVYLIFKYNLDRVEKIKEKTMKEESIDYIMELTGNDTLRDTLLNNIDNKKVYKFLKNAKYLRRETNKCMLFPCEPIKIIPRKGDMIADLKIIFKRLFQRKPFSYFDKLLYVYVNNIWEDTRDVHSSDRIYYPDYPIEYTYGFSRWFIMRLSDVYNYISDDGIVIEGNKFKDISGGLTIFRKFEKYINKYSFSLHGYLRFFIKDFLFEMVLIEKDTLYEYKYDTSFD